LEKHAALAKRLSAVLREHGAEIVKLDAFGAIAARSEILGVLEEAFGGTRWPVTWIEGAPCGGGAMAGLQVFAVAGTPVETIELNGRPVGRGFDDGRARHVLFGGIEPADASSPRDVQAGRAFEVFDAALRAAGMDWSHVARTWFFLDDILGWYGPFNAVRTGYFQRRLPDSFLPASTGVGARNAPGKAVEAAAWAARLPDGSACAKEVPSPQQCPAPRYGSSFSRAVELAGPGYRRVLVSGTASIAPGGETARVGDPRGQIDLTMGVVRAILESRGLDYSNVSRALVYFKDCRDLSTFEAWQAAQGHLPGRQIDDAWRFLIL
jgi:enamine deaminase RidA (YjgF/YER057c/UK114 family)